MAKKAKGGFQPGMGRATARKAAMQTKKASGAKPPPGVRQRMQEGRKDAKSAFQGLRKDVQTARTSLRDSVRSGAMSRKAKGGFSSSTGRSTGAKGPKRGTGFGAGGTPPPFRPPSGSSGGGTTSTPTMSKPYPARS